MSTKDDVPRHERRPDHEDDQDRAMFLVSLCVFALFGFIAGMFFAVMFIS